MVQPIAIVRLAPGEVGYYDPYTKIHLTLSRKEATVYNYMNTSRLKTAIADRILILKAGSLNSINYMVKADETKAANYKEPASFTAKVEQPKVEAVVEPEVKKEIPVEEPVAEVKPAASKKKTAAKPAVEDKTEEVELKTGEEKTTK